MTQLWKVAEKKKRRHTVFYTLQGRKWGQTNSIALWKASSILFADGLVSTKESSKLLVIHPLKDVCCMVLRYHPLFWYSRTNCHVFHKVSITTTQAFLDIWGVVLASSMSPSLLGRTEPISHADWACGKRYLRKERKCQMVIRGGNRSEKEQMQHQGQKRRRWWWFSRHWSRYSAAAIKIPHHSKNSKRKECQSCSYRSTITQYPHAPIHNTSQLKESVVKKSWAWKRSEGRYCFNASLVPH